MSRHFPYIYSHIYMMHVKVLPFYVATFIWYMARDLEFPYLKYMFGVRKMWSWVFPSPYREWKYVEYLYIQLDFLDNIFTFLSSIAEENTANLQMPSFGEDDHINTYKLSEAGKKQLTKLLCVLHHTRPDINYCPFLPSIASLLLHYMDTEQAFDAVSALLGSQR